MAGLASATYNPNDNAPFQIEMATSGRSSCRNPSCIGPSKKIKKGELRIARMEASPTESLNSRLYGKLFPKWVHMKCCAPVILQEALTKYGGNIENVPGFDTLEATSICPNPQAQVHCWTRIILGLEEKEEEINGTTVTTTNKNNNKNEDTQQAMTMRQDGRGSSGRRLRRRKNQIAVP